MVPCPFCDRRADRSAPLCPGCRLHLIEKRARFAEDGTEFTPGELEAIYRLAYSTMPRDDEWEAAFVRASAATMGSSGRSFITGPL